MLKSEKYFFDGYNLDSFKSGELHRRLVNTTSNIFKGQIREGFYLKEKYPYSKDLRPSVYEYDESFVDILFENNIPTKFREILGYDLYLAHIQYRVVHSRNSYMQWHRDTHFYDGKLGGNAPPVHKIIYYPSVNNVDEPCLQVAKGSQLRMFNNEHQDISQLHHNEINTINSSNENYVFFNTSMLHHPIVPKVGSGNVRVVYSFCCEFQLEKYPDQVELHKIYKKKLEEYKWDEND
jgi:hypothetical protein